MQLCHATCAVGGVASGVFCFVFVFWAGVGGGGGRGSKRAGQDQKKGEQAFVSSRPTRNREPTCIPVLYIVYCTLDLLSCMLATPVFFPIQHHRLRSKNMILAARTHSNYLHENTYTDTDDTDTRDDNDNDRQDETHARTPTAGKG